MLIAADYQLGNVTSHWRKGRIPTLCQPARWFYPSSATANKTGHGRRAHTYESLFTSAVKGLKTGFGIGELGSVWSGNSRSCSVLAFGVLLSVTVLLARSTKRAIFAHEREGISGRERCSGCGINSVRSGVGRSPPWREPLAHRSQVDC